MASKGMPQDLTMEIMARLPAKSLMRFKSLSKFYHTVFKEYSFITKHFQFSNQKPYLLIFHCRSKLSSKPCISLFSEELSQIPVNSGLRIPEKSQASLDSGLSLAEESQRPIDLGLLVPKTLLAPIDLGLPFAEELQPPIDLGLLISETLQAPLDLGLPMPEESQPPIDLTFPGVSQLLGDLIPEISQSFDDLGVPFPESSQSPFDACLPFPNVSQPSENLVIPIPKVSQPPFDLELPFPDKKVHKIVPYGPCNGIFCLYGSYFDSPDQFILWNPATKEVKVLPLPNHPLSGMEMCTHGFGIDPKTNDYKVVCVLTSMELQLAFEFLGETQLPSIEVYSLRTNSWRSINVTIPAFKFGDSVFNSYLNGVYHWLAMNREVIVCFDMSTEVFFEMKLPPVIEDYTNEHLIDCNVAVLGDCIAYVKEYCSQLLLGHRIEIWVMNEHGVEESWTKRFSIGPLLGSFRGFWKDGEILVTGEDNETLVSYNLDTQQPVLKIPVDCGLMFFPPVRYVESIFPISVMAKDSGETTQSSVPS